MSSFVVWYCVCVCVQLTNVWVFLFVYTWSYCMLQKRTTCTCFSWYWYPYPIRWESGTLFPSCHNFMPADILLEPLKQHKPGISIANANVCEERVLFRRPNVGVWKLHSLNELWGRKKNPTKPWKEKHGHGPPAVLAPCDVECSSPLWEMFVNSSGGEFWKFMSRPFKKRRNDHEESTKNLAVFSLPCKSAFIFEVFDHSKGSACHGPCLSGGRCCLKDVLFEFRTLPAPLAATSSRTGAVHECFKAIGFEPNTRSQKGARTERLIHYCHNSCQKKTRNLPKLTKSIIP